MIYLASPYSHPSPTVRQQRYEQAVEHAVMLVNKRNEAVFSPIAHSHPMALHGLSGAWEMWAEMDLAVIAICEELVVLQLRGWEHSRGIAAEIAEARRLGIPVTYLAQQYETIMEVVK